jgi:large subunit ribosomal protein L22
MAQETAANKMEAKAVKRYIRTSPRKMRLIVDLIRDKKVDEAIGILRFSKKHSAKVVEKTVLSAYSNLVNKLDSGRIAQSDVRIAEAFVDGGPMFKRILPAPQGRAYRIRKRSAHLTLVVQQVEDNQ